MAAGIAVCAPPLASAAATIGGDIDVPGDPTQPCALACELAQISLAGGQTTAPFDGVVVRWRVNGATGPLSLRVLRSVASTPNFTFISTSAPARPATPGVETFATRQPIRAGDYVGLEWGSFDARIGVAALGVSGDAVPEWAFVPDGRTKVTLRLSHTNAALVGRALAKRARLKAIVALSVKDSAGNPSATKLSLKLRR